MSGRFEGRKVVVTGGGSGIGEAVCRLFVREGGDVTVIDRDADAAHRVLTRPSRELTGRTLLVEQVLHEAGITDLSAYAYVPGTPDSALQRDIFLD